MSTTALRHLSLPAALVLLVAASLLVGCVASGSASVDSGSDAATPAADGSANGDDANQGDQDPDATQERAAAGDAQDGDEQEEEGATPDSAEAKKPQAIPVEVTALERGSIESVLKSSATLEAEREVEVFSQAARLVRELLVEEGDRVERNQVLLRLQDDEQRNALARVRNELAKARREYGRQQRLYEENLISEEVFNEATFELEQLRIAEADAQRELGYTEVRAPIRGTITQRLVNVGDQVTVGQHLFDIIDFDSLVARIYVPEKHLPNLRRGQRARLSARAAGTRDYTGRVDRIAPIVDARSGTVKVTIDVGGQRGLLPGMYVDVDLITATRSDAVLIPKRALVYDNDQMFVFRLGDERRVERIFVVPRLTDKRHVEPVAGLGAGDLIVVAGQAGLKDGALVKLPGDDDKPAAEEEEGADEAAAVERASR